MSVALVLTAATAPSSFESTLAISSDVAGPAYARQALGATPSSYDTVFLDVSPSTSAVTIKNQPSGWTTSAVTVTVTPIAYDCPAAMVRTDRKLVERWAWLGWEGSNINAFSVSGTPYSVNCRVSVTSPIILFGMHVDLSMAVGNAATSRFIEMLSIGGYQRVSEPSPFAIGLNAANPSNLSAPGFGTPTADTNVNWGPNTSAFPGTLFTNILKSANSSVSRGADAHIYVDCHELQLEANAVLWFHMAAQSESPSTSTIDGEMQVAVRYALL
jgi:hypothetical protein